MADKLGEASWKAFTKKQKLALDDGALLKALGRFDKSDVAKPEPRIEALDEVLEQARKQVAALAKKKKELGDKPFNEAKDKLYEVIEGAERLLKETRAALESAQSEDEEGDSPVLLTTKMVPLLRELRKGEKTMHAMIGVAGKNMAVLIMRRPIAPARRKILAEAIDAKGGAKYIVGECMFEDKALTFVVKTQAAGLAKRLKAALLEQTEMRLKVRVRGEDPKDVDEDGEDGGEEQEGVQPQVQQPPPGHPATAEQLAYTQRLNKVRTRLEEALRAQHPEATKLRAVSAFASEKAAADDYAAATKALQTLEKLLDGSTSAGPGGVDPGVALKARMAALVPRIKQAQEAGSVTGQEAKLKVSQAAVMSTKRDFAGANALLDEAEALLEGQGGTAPGAAATAANEPDGVATAVRTAQAAVGARLAAKPGFDSLTKDLAGARDALVVARDALDDAFATADAQVRTLQAFLAVHPDQELRAIAGSPEFGINALTAGYRVKLTGAMRELVGAPASDLPRALTRARQLVAEFRFHVQSSDRIEACDENPVGVSVGIRGSLGSALRRTADAVEGFAA